MADDVLHAPSIALLSWEGGGECPVQYEVESGGWSYYVRYRGGWCTLYGAPGTWFDDNEGLFQQQLSDNTYDGAWNDRETNAYLSLLSDAIVTGTVGVLVLPSKLEVSQHPLYQR